MTGGHCTAYLTATIPVDLSGHSAEGGLPTATAISKNKVLFPGRNAVMGSGRKPSRVKGAACTRTCLTG